MLREAGIEVEVGVLEQEAKRLNAAYFKYMTTGMPLVSLKAAMSLDGKIATATGESQWITGERARKEAHRLRARHDAVLVGVGTVLADQPRLTVRKVRGRSPLRVVVDSEARVACQARTPPEAALLGADERAPIIAVTERAPKDRVEALERVGAQVWVGPAADGKVDLRALMRRLAEHQVQSVLVEGGGTVAAAALAAGLVDRVYFFIAPLIIGGERALTPVEGEGIGRLAEAWRLERVKVRRVGEDLLITGEVAR